ATKAALSFVEKTLRAADRCAVYTIQDVPRRQVDLTNDKEAVKKALSSIRPQGQTSLYDAIATAIRERKGRKNRRAIVILTDGGDTSSIASYEEIEKQATESGIPIYFIAYGDQLGSDQHHDVERMKFIAGQTGGFVAFASDDNLTAKYGEIEK